MLGAIRSAQTSITLETYICWTGSVSQLDEELLAQMRAGGVDIQHHNPLAWLNLQRMNHRTHRRLMVVDGRVGFMT